MDRNNSKPADRFIDPDLNDMDCGHVDDALRAPIRAVDNSDELPTTPIFAHMPTVHYHLIKIPKADIST